MNRQNLLLLMGVLMAVFLAACTLETTEIVEPTPIPAVPTETPFPTPGEIVVVTVEVSSPGPAATPAVCTPLPAHMTLKIIPLSATSFNLELTGLQQNEELIIIVRGETATESAELTWQPIGDRVVDGRASERITLGHYDDIQYWQGKVIHALGVACFEFSLPLASDEMEMGVTPTPLLTTSPEARILRTDQTLWFAQGNAVWRSDIHGVELEQLTRDDFLSSESLYWPGGLENIQLSPDGRWLANYHGDDGLHLADIITGREIVLPVTTYALTWSPDSRFLAYAPAFSPARPTLDCTLCLYDLATEAHVILIPTTDAPVDSLYNLVWSPDGEKLAYACCLTAREPYDGFSDGRIEIVTIASGEREAVGPISASMGGGEYICWTDTGEIITSWVIQEVCVDPARIVTALSVDNLLAAWSADYDQENQWITTRLHVTNQATGQLLWERIMDSASGLRLAWSLDGRYLFFSDDYLTTPIWRVTADGENLTEIMAEGYLLGVVRAWEALTPPLTVSPDGRWRVVAHTSTPVIVGEDEMAEFPSGAKYRVAMYVESTDSDLVWTVVDEWRNSGLGYDSPGPLQWSADGRYLFFTNIPRPDGCSVFVNGGDLWRLDLQTGEAVQLLPFVGMAMALSPDSQILAYHGSSGRGFQLHDLATGIETPVDLPDYAGDWWQIGGISWSPNGQHLLLTQVLDPCGERLTAVIRIDLPENQVTTLIEPDERNFTLLNWLRDREIRLLDEDGRIWYLESESGLIAGGLPLD